MKRQISDLVSPKLQCSKIYIYIFLFSSFLGSCGILQSHPADSSFQNMNAITADTFFFYIQIMP